MNKHIIFTNGRSGSNYLTNLLNAHPRILNYGEVLGEWTLPYKLHVRFGLGGRSASEYLNSLYTSPSIFYAAQIYLALSRIPRGKKTRIKPWHKLDSLGVKDFSINFKKRKLTSFLLEHDEILIINLYRENQLKRFLSLEMMEKTGVVALNEKHKSKDSDGSKRNRKLHLRPEYVLEQLTKYRSELEEQLASVRQISQQRVLNIRYEDLFESNESKAAYGKKVFDFLGADPIEVKSKHKKILSNEPSDLIENYEEIQSALKNTEFEEYLET